MIRINLSNSHTWKWWEVMDSSHRVIKKSKDHRRWVFSYVATKEKARDYLHYLAWKFSIVGHVHYCITNVWVVLISMS